MGRKLKIPKIRFLLNPQQYVVEEIPDFCVCIDSIKIKLKLCIQDSIIIHWKLWFCRFNLKLWSEDCYGLDYQNIFFLPLALAD